MEDSKQLLPIWMRKDLSNPRIARDVFRENRYELIPFLIRDGKRHKTAIICPGGGYNMVCNYIEGEPYAKMLNAMGISAFVVCYRCRELSAYPAPQDDLARAIREVFSHAQQWNLDMEGYSVWGSSAGGHLAGSFGTKAMGYARCQLPPPGALILAYPVVTMGAMTHEGTRRNLLGPNPTHDVIRQTSIEQQIDPEYPPTYVWCGSADSCVMPENSRMLAAALEQQRIPYQFREYPGIDHGVGLGTGSSCEGWFQEAVSFWLAQIHK